MARNLGEALGLAGLYFDPREPVVLLADIHANIEALEAAVAWIDQRSFSQVLVLGDSVGYGASPVEVLHLLRERAWPILLGNHEEILVDPGAARARFVKQRVLRALDWTRPLLQTETLDWLASLPRGFRIDDGAIAVHGSVADRSLCNAYIYDLSLELNLQRLAELHAPEHFVVFFGHTHLAALYRATSQTDWTHIAPDDQGTSLREPARFFANPGSVGYPRDGDRRAGLAVWYPAEQRMRWARLEYDVQAATEKILQRRGDEETAARILQAR